MLYELRVTSYIKKKGTSVKNGVEEKNKYVLSYLSRYVSI